jgi:hypothetical protein
MLITDKNEWGIIDIYPYADTEQEAVASLRIEVFTRPDLVGAIGGAVRVFNISGNRATSREDWEKFKEGVEKAFELAENTK